MSRLPNILLLTIDALRADHLSYNGYVRSTSPFLDKFAEENIYFTDALSASSHTREAVPALITGRQPRFFSDNGYRLVGNSVGKRLADEGYETAAFHSNPYISRAYGYDDGFSTFDDDLYLGRNKLLALSQRLLDKLRNRHYASAAEINERSISWLKDRTHDRPFFLWNHYMDVHGPYQPPEPHRSQYHADKVHDRALLRLYKRSVSDPESIEERERDLQIDMYDGEINYIDRQLSNLFDTLREFQLLEDSYVIITADHGDAFGEHGYYGHPRELDDELLSIPLLLSTPDGESREVSVPTSALDVVPTLLDIANASTGSDLLGSSLCSITENPTDFEDRAIFAEVCSEDGEYRQYRAHSASDDCTIQENLSDGASTVLVEPVNESLLDELRQYRDTDGNRDLVDSDSESSDTPASVANRLEALGYRE